MIDYSYCKIIKPPIIVGCIKLWKGFEIHAYKKPNWFNLKMMKMVFGWEWIDD